MAKKYIVISTCVFMLVVSSVIGKYVFEKKQIEENTTPIQTSTLDQIQEGGESEVENTTEDVVIVTSDIDTSDWQVYRNTKYGFELKYPKDWAVTDENLRIETSEYHSLDLWSENNIESLIFVFDKEETNSIPVYLDMKKGPGNYQITELLPSGLRVKNLGGELPWYKIYVYEQEPEESSAVSFVEAIFLDGPEYYLAFFGSEISDTVEAIALSVTFDH